MLTIHLGQDENDCFSAWVSAKETGLAENDAVDQKGNIYFLYLFYYYFIIFLCCFLNFFFFFFFFLIFFFFFSELWKSFTTSST